MEENYFVRLKKLLKDRSVSVESLLEAVDLPKTQYHSLLRYDNCPRADLAVKIAQYLGTSVEYMVTGTSSDSLPSDIVTPVRQLLTLDKARRAPILANISSQVEFWRSASADIVPKLEITNEEDDELLEQYHKLSDNNKKLVRDIISAILSDNSN